MRTDTRGRRALCALLISAAAGGGCALDNPPEVFPAPSFEYFSCAVQPILARECAFAGCHGSPERGLKLLAPGRMRIGSELEAALAAMPAEQIEEGRQPPLTAAELTFNYEQCRGFVASSDPTQAPQLLSRPLASAGDGLYHGPNADVFASPEDVRYQVLSRWIRGAGPEGCP